MREIKFRAWDPQQKMMVDWPWLEIYATGARIVDEEGDIYDASDMSLMQFTGLKDKNEKEIYEGDIVKYQEKNSSLGDVVAIEFREGCFCVGTERQGWTVGNRRMIIEVIGNIYENPELLNASTPTPPAPQRSQHPLPQ